MLFFRLLELAPPSLSKGCELSVLEPMGAVRRGVLARKLSSGAVRGQVDNEMTSPRAGLEGPPPAAAQGSSTASSPELTSQPRELLLVSDSAGAGQRVTSTNMGLGAPELSPIVPALWQLSSSDPLPLVVYRRAHPLPGLLPLRRGLCP